MSRPRKSGSREPSGRPKLGSEVDLGNWTPEMVREGLENAAQAIKGMPAHGCFPAGHRAQWPAVPLTSIWELYNGMSESEIYERQRDINAQKTRVGPTPGQITESDIIIRAVYKLPVRDRRLLWARANRISFRKIQVFDGRNREWLRQLANRHYENLAIDLNRLAKPAKIG